MFVSYLKQACRMGRAPTLLLAEVEIDLAFVLETAKPNSTEELNLEEVLRARFLLRQFDGPSQGPSAPDGQQHP